MIILWTGFRNWVLELGPLNPVLEPSPSPSSPWDFIGPDQDQTRTGPDRTFNIPIYNVLQDCFGQ